MVTTLCGWSAGSWVWCFGSFSSLLLRLILESVALDLFFFLFRCSSECLLYCYWMRGLQSKFQTTGVNCTANTLTVCTLLSPCSLQPTLLVCRKRRLRIKSEMFLGDRNIEPEPFKPAAVCCYHKTTQSSTNLSSKTKEYMFPCRRKNIP